MELLKIALAGLISALVALFVNYLGFSAKSDEIKLSTYHKDRIEAVKMLYSLIVDLHYANLRLFISSNEEIDCEAYKSLLKNWLSMFSSVNQFYNKNRILLLEEGDLSKKIKVKLGQLSALREIVVKEYNEVLVSENQFSDLYQEQEEVGKWAKKFRSGSNVNSLINSFDTIRKDLEDYFRSLVAIKSLRFWNGVSSQPTKRLLIIATILMILSAAAGFTWGHWYGYNQGKSSIVKQIDK